MDDLKEYYRNENLVINYDHLKKGYWLDMKDNPGGGKYFVDNRSFQDVINSDTIGKISKLKLLDNMIYLSLNDSCTSPMGLCEALDEVKNKLKIEFKKTNNL
jgi:hypothetical protein